MGFLIRNWRLVLATLIIVALSWIDSQYFSEGTSFSEGTRKMMHLLFLLCIQITGYIYWMRHETGWLKHVWMAGYFSMFFILICVGALNWKFDLFGTTFLDQVRTLRTFFSSPLPFIGTIVFAEIFAKQPSVKSVNLK